LLLNEKLVIRFQRKVNLVQQNSRYDRLLQITT